MGRPLEKYRETAHIKGGPFFFFSFNLTALYGPFYLQKEATLLLIPSSPKAHTQEPKWNHLHLKLEPLRIPAAFMNSVWFRQIWPPARDSVRGSVLQKFKNWITVHLLIVDDFAADSAFSSWAPALKFRPYLIIFLSIFV